MLSHGDSLRWFWKNFVAYSVLRNSVGRIIHPLKSLQSKPTQLIRKPKAGFG